MARQPTLRKKTVSDRVYWFTKAGGDTYFGRVGEMTAKEAKKAFATHLVKVQDETAASKRTTLTAGELMDLYLDWVKQKRAAQNYTTRKTYCSRFGQFTPAGRKTRVADLPADQVRGDDLEKWLVTLEEQALEAQTRLHAETSVRAAWNWATKHPAPVPYLPRTFRPFSATERTRVEDKPLTEVDLITDDEVHAIFKAAAIEPNQFRRHGLAKTVEKKGVDGLRRTEGKVGCFADLLRCYHATGARTNELASCRVADVMFGSRQLVLGKHKQSRTQKAKTVRQVTLNDEAFAIFVRNCEGKQPTDHVFINENGNPWTVRNLAKRFDRVRTIASGLKFGTVRPDKTIYDFRHLWISESLMAGNDVVLVARMAGTSIAMIERVYGHFRNQFLHDAQAKLDELRRSRHGS